MSTTAAPTTLPEVEAIAAEAASCSPLWHNDRIGGYLRITPPTFREAVEAVRGGRPALVRYLADASPSYGFAVVEWEGGWGIVAPSKFKGGFNLITPAN